MTLVSKAISTRYTDDDTAFEVSLKVLTGLMTGAGLLVSALHWYVHRLNDKEVKNRGTPEPVKQDIVKKEKKPKLSFAESLKVLSSSRYLRNIATMVLSYGLTIEFTEIIWKATVKKAFPIKTDYLKFMGRYSAMVGTSATVMMFVGAKIVKGLGWRAGALVTPAMMGLLAIPFFGCLILGGISSEKALLVAVYVGLLQNVLSKATKYAIFDPTKEMTYIPLDKESKTKGKAAIDVMGARLGKSGGAFAQQLLVICFGSIIGSAPVIAILFSLGILAWLGTALSFL